jgi:hypothetical protein
MRSLSAAERNHAAHLHVLNMSPKRSLAHRPRDLQEDLEGMDGRIWVDSERGKGSAFCFTITPASQNESSPADSILSSPGSGDAFSASAKYSL